MRTNHEQCSAGVASYNCTGGKAVKRVCEDNSAENFFPRDRRRSHRKGCSRPSKGASALHDGQLGCWPLQSIGDPLNATFFELSGKGIPHNACRYDCCYVPKQPRISFQSSRDHTSPQKGVPDEPDDSGFSCPKPPGIQGNLAEPGRSSAKGPGGPALPPPA